ncbi:MULTISPECIES: ParB N-terminal domain-containing protein [unclassified Leucobacter]
MNTTASASERTVAQFPIESIVLGRSYRRELGDLTDLTTSIQTLGLLCPIVITSDAVLISGRRRLEVMRQLGHTTVPVWVASEVSDKLRTLLAIQDDNLLHKHFTTTEKAALYAEYKTLLTEENARRQAATRFGAAALPGSDDGEADDTDPDEREAMIVATYQGSGSGRWDSQPPSKRKSRVQAATAVTGRDSSQQLEQILALERLATNEDEDERVRRAAAEAVVEINGDAKVHGRYHEVLALRGVCWLEKTAVNETATAAVREAADDELRAVRQIDRPVERSRAVAAAIARVRKLALTPTSDVRTAEDGDSGAEDEVMSADGVRGRYHARRLVDILTKAEGWWEINDAALVGRYATDEQWDAITSHRDQANAFLDTAAHARRAISGAGVLP